MDRIEHYQSPSMLRRRAGKTRIKPSGGDQENLGRLFQTKGPPPIPRCAALSFIEYPFLVKVSSIGMFCTIIAVSMPYWFWFWVAESKVEATFGLWHFCPNGVNKCTSIHDNIIPNRDVPVWYIMVQWCFLIGSVMSLVVLTILMHNYDGKIVKMPPTVYTVAEYVSAIATLQKGMSLYVLISNMENLDFLCPLGAETHCHVAFYCAATSLLCDVILAVDLFLNEVIGPATVTNNILIQGAKEYEELNVFKQGADTYLYNPDTAEMEYHLHTH